MLEILRYAAILLFLPIALRAQETSKPVVAHFMVGNTFPYTRDDWRRDITLAASRGIDGFALNIGRDPWQLERVADAYEVARTLNSGFSLFPSFDMGSLPCRQERDGDLLRNFVNTYQQHSNMFRFRGRPVVSTFGGQRCHFGSPTVNGGWRRVLKTNMTTEVHFVASFFMDPAIYGSIDAADGAFSWDSAWPMGNYDISDEYDVEFRKYLPGRTYMAGVSPWFFTHYGPESFNKNFIFRADNWLLASRWEILVRNREHIDLVQVISWNDYGESHYMGPIAGAQPNSTSWTTGFDHQGWLDLQQYYITAFKSGAYPPVERDRVFLWGRLYPAKATSPDGLSKPLNSEFTEDFVWAVVLLTSAGQLRLSCGNSVIARDLPGYQFSTTPPMYNFNAFVAASP
ncbi:hypothetical protein H1R20_g10981, partial [Candolleomyces eurysporus]